LPRICAARRLVPDGDGVRRRRIRLPSGSTLAAAALVLAALGLRVWGIKHGLPFVYNVDESANFVPSAVGFFSGDYDPHYFINPPAFSYLLHAVLALWYGGGWPLGAGSKVSDVYATDPASVFLVARVTAAVLGAAAVAFVYATGARLADRRVGLVAAALLAVGFLPVFYSHLALNDVPALLPLAVSTYGSAGILTRGRRRDYLIAGAGLGLAAATKYTAGIVVLPLAAAAASRLLAGDRPRRPAMEGLVVAGVAAAATFVVANPHAMLSFSEFWADVRKQESAAGDLGKLGLTNDSGITYYLWVLTWGIGWAPAIAAAIGALVAFRRSVVTGLFLVPWPVVFIVYMGLQDRYFGRWLLPALPAVVLLAALAVVAVADRLRAGPRVRTAVVAGAAVALLGQGVVYSIHLDRVLSRDETRNLAHDWMVANVPVGAKIVVEPIVPGSWTTEPANPRLAARSGRRWVKFIVTRTTIDEQGHKRRGNVGRTITIEDYERTTRPALVGSYARGGYCWVVIGSTQYGRAQREPQEVPRALRYYRALARHGDVVLRADPYKAGEGPVEFNFDWSFDYYPMAYERPGPHVAVFRLREGKCAPQRADEKRVAKRGN
jgi:dolichyl-phosphate-mannose-protein mannosyltransferase